MRGHHDHPPHHPVGAVPRDGSMSVLINRETVREFITAIAARAQAALKGKEKPGYLQMSRLHPASNELVPSRYKPDDVERMINDAIASCEAGHNVYVEGRTVRETVCGKKRGELEDTAFVFALVIDSDADKGMGWKPNGSSPSMKVETSPGNSHDWIFLREAVAADVGQKLGERIRKVTGTDHDTGNVTQPYRVAGTINFPSKKKQARGRVTVPTQLINLNAEALWTPEDIERAFPLPKQPDPSGNRGTAAPARDVDEASIPTDTMRVIRDGPSASASSCDRSQTFWNVTVALKRVGFTVEGIVDLLERYPDGIAKKYEGRLRHEVERVYNKLDQEQQYGYGAQAAAATPAPEIVFDPWARYVVPVFLFDILPPLVQEFVGAEAAVIGCDPSALAMCTLGTFSGALHHDLALKMLRNGNWFVSPRLWLLLVAPVSGKKTPMLKAATRPLVHYEARVHDLHRDAMRKYKQAKAQGDSASQMQEPEPPPCYLAWDTTVESLGELLARGDGKKGVLVLADEVSGWLGSMEMLWGRRRGCGTFGAFHANRRGAPCRSQIIPTNPLFLLSKTAQ